MNNSSERLLKHFVVSGYIVFKNQVLLVAHRGLGKWLPPGGHIEDYETPDEALMREVAEEIDIPVRLISPKDTRGDDAGVHSLYMPCHIQVEKIDDRHQHIDLVYFCEAVENKISLEESELSAARWFSPDEFDTTRDILFNDITLPKHVSLFSLCALENSRGK